MERKVREQEEFKLGSIEDHFNENLGISSFNPRVEDVFGDVGESRSQQKVREQMEEQQADAVVDSFLDSFNWGF